eukprot:jgi/Astpho2/7735/Aster-07577
MQNALQRFSRPLAQKIQDAHGEVKLNAWEAPTSISKWKEEHIVFLVLGCWAAGITTAMKVFGGKKEGSPGEPTGSPAPAKH